MPYEVSAAVRARAVRECMAILDSAVLPHEIGQYLLLEEEQDQFIRKEIDRMLYVPQLPWGSHEERKWKELMQEMAKNESLLMDEQRAAFAMAEAFRQVDRCYYFRQPLSPTTGRKQYERYSDLLMAAEMARDWEKKWFAEQMLAGFPKPLSDFRMICRYMVRMPDGTIHRLVRLRNVMGEQTEDLELDADSFKSPEHFRKWCLSKGAYAFGIGKGGNQTHLQALHADVNRATAFRTLNVLTYFGWHKVGVKRTPDGPVCEGLFVFDDACYGPEGRIHPGEEGIYWYKGEGYRLCERHPEGKFHLGRPQLKPDAAIMEADMSLFREETPDAEQRVKWLYWEMCERLQKTVGGLEGFLIAGAFLSYAAAPEIYEERSNFPGLWLHGQAGSGKTTIVEWLSFVFGFSLTQGLQLQGAATTQVGLLQALDQNSNLPVWADDYKFGKVSEEKLSVLHTAFGRGGQAKWNATEVMREMRSMFVVTGEATVGDAGFRSRYAHFQISKSQREKQDGQEVDHFTWFSKHKRHFHFIGRFLFERRTAFAAATLKWLRHWDDTSGLSDRNRFVYGTGYAAFMAMAELTGAFKPEEMEAKFRAVAVKHAASEASDVAAQTNVNVFIEDMITAFRNGEIPVECFRVKGTPRDFPPETSQYAPAPEQGLWMSYELYIDVGPLLATMKVYLAKQREGMVLNRNDLRDQLSLTPFWKTPKGTIRFKGGDASVRPWCISVDEHPLGYQWVDDAEFQQYQENKSAGDPRMGPLFSIVNKVLEDVEGKMQGGVGNYEDGTVWQRD